MPAPYPPDNRNTAENWYNYGNTQGQGLHDWFSRMGMDPKVSNLIPTTGYRSLEGLTNLGGPIGQMGYANLAQILRSNGRTDPAVLNRNLAGVSRGTQANQSQAGGIMAQRGLGGWQGGIGLQAAIGQAGVGQQAGLRAQEEQKAEMLRRSDLSDLLKNLIVQPGFDASAMALGQYNSDRNRNDQNKAANMQLMAMLAAAAASACWAAEEVFHDADDEDAVRLYMAAHPDLLDLYLRAGMDLAYTIRHEESVRRVVTPRFHEFAEWGYAL